MDIKIQKSTKSLAEEIFGKFMQFDKDSLFGFEIAYIIALTKEMNELSKHPEVDANSFVIMTRITVSKIFSRVADYTKELINQNFTDGNEMYNLSVHSPYGTISTGDINMYISGIINKFNTLILASAIVHNHPLSYWDYDEEQIKRNVMTIPELCAKINMVNDYLVSMIKFGELCYAAMNPLFKVNYCAPNLLPATIPSNSMQNLYHMNEYYL